MLTVLLLAAPGFASEIDVLPYTGTFPTGNIDGKQGWTSGYGPDPWPAYNNGDDATAETDDNASGSTWGVGDAMDNWLLQENIATVSQGGIESNFQNLDDDGCGVVFANTAGGNTYVAFWSANTAPPPVDTVPQEEIVLLRVENGTAVPIGSQNVSFDAAAADHLLRLERNDDHVKVSLDGGVIIDYLETAPLPAGFAGFYAYNNGDVLGGGGNAATVYFEDVRIFQFDDDDDLVPDDADNCEFVANADQADDDGDAIGNLCDPDYVPPQTTGTTTGDTTGTTGGDADTDSDADSDADMDADTDSDTDNPGGTDSATKGEVLVVGGGCDTGPVGLPLAGVAIAALLAVSRRRRG